LLAPKYAKEKKTRSETITPKSIKTACLIPLVMLVSSSMKKIGPKEKERINPNTTASM
jgi:hypothetical protein